MFNMVLYVLSHWKYIYKTIATITIPVANYIAYLLFSM